MKTLLTLSICFLLLRSVGADERIRFEVKINGKKAVLAFDTGAETFILFEPAAQVLEYFFSRS